MQALAARDLEECVQTAYSLLAKEASYKSSFASSFTTSTIGKYIAVSKHINTPTGIGIASMLTISLSNWGIIPKGI